MNKLPIILIVTSLLVGCSGEYRKIPLQKPDGTLVTNALGMPVYEKIKISRSVAIMERANEAASNLPKEDQNKLAHCMYATPDQLAAMPATTGVEVARMMGQCAMAAGYSDIVAKALKLPQSQVEAIYQNSQRVVASVEKGMTDRVAIGGRVATGGLITINTRKAIESSHDALKTVGTEAARTGNTTVGDINVSANQNTSADSNDGSGGGLADASTGENGSIAPSLSGSGSGVSDTIKDGDVINLAIGNNNSIGVAQDAGKNAVDTQATQLLEPESTGLIVEEDANADQPVIGDDNQTEQSSSIDTKLF